MTCVPLILALMLSWPQYHLDRGDPAAARRALYRPVAEAICAVGKTRLERAWLVVQSYHETHWARYVLENRCSEGPPGARCDEGRATGPWQVHSHCAVAWRRTGHFTRKQRQAGARCALRVARMGLRRCKTTEGAFAHQRGSGRCHAPWAAARARRVEQMIRKVP